MANCNLINILSCFTSNCRNTSQEPNRTFKRLMFKGFLSRRISFFLMILFITLNSILIYFDIFYLLALPLVLLLGYLFVFRLDLIFLTIVFCTPLSFNFENLDLLGIGFYFPTEPMLLLFTLMFLFKALYEKNLKKDLLHYKNPVIILVFIQVLWIFICLLYTSPSPRDA